MMVIVMGVSGSGKTTVGQLLAAELGWVFLEGDEFHPLSNIEKMSRGAPLTHADRVPWLGAIHAAMAQSVRDGRSAVVACSALSRAARDILVGDLEVVRLVYLKGSFADIERRMTARQGHYMKPGMLRSQFDALEEPVDALVVDATAEPRVIVEQIKRGLHLAR